MFTEGITICPLELLLCFSARPPRWAVASYHEDPYLQKQEAFLGCSYHTDPKRLRKMTTIPDPHLLPLVPNILWKLCVTVPTSALHALSLLSLRLRHVHRELDGEQSERHTPAVTQNHSFPQKSRASSPGAAVCQFLSQSPSSVAPQSLLQTGSDTPLHLPSR